MINDVSLKKLVEEFSRPRPEFDGKSYITRRRDWFDKPMENIRPLLEKDALDHLTLEDAQRIYNEMTVGGPKLYPRTFIENGLDKIKASLKYLLYGEDQLRDRFYNFMQNPESEYRLSGAGRAFASTALLLINHHKYGIWNGAVDGGLKMLGMLPERKRGEHMGETYDRILSVLKQLQERCGFEDMSVVDEFVELVYHEKIGAEILRRRDKEIEKAGEQEEVTLPPEVVNDAHLRCQYLLTKIGQMRGYDVWVAANDRNKSYKGEPLSSMALNELPHFAGLNVLSIAKSIDVIWFKKGTAVPVCFFEIEHTTSIFSGLLRLNDVKTDYPIPQAYIVGPKERKKLFDTQIQRRTFAASELLDICQFLTYDEVEKLMASYQAIKGILP